MDPKIGWYQPEQFGPAKDLWLHIWETGKDLDNLTLKHDNSATMSGKSIAQDYVPLESTLNNRPLSNDGPRGVQQHNTCNNYYNPSRRKGDNRASTYGMNYNYEVLVGEYGGCPWQVPTKRYSKGVLG